MPDMRLYVFAAMLPSAFRSLARSCRLTKSSVHTSFVMSSAALSFLQLPAASVPPAANYVPWVQTGNLVFISGQVIQCHSQLTFAVQIILHPFSFPRI